MIHCWNSLFCIDNSYVWLFDWLDRNTFNLFICLKKFMIGVEMFIWQKKMIHHIEPYHHFHYGVLLLLRLNSVLFDSSFGIFHYRGEHTSHRDEIYINKIKRIIWNKNTSSKQTTSYEKHLKFLTFYLRPPMVTSKKEISH